MSVVMQSRALFSNGKAVGVDGISAEVLKTLPWRALQKIKNAFELRYKGQSQEDIESWLRNIIVLKPKKKVIDRLEVHLCAELFWQSGTVDVLLF